MVWPAPQRPRPTWTTRPWDTVTWPRVARWRTPRTGSVPLRPWPPGRTTRPWAITYRPPQPQRLSRPATDTTAPASLLPLPPQPQPPPVDTTMGITRTIIQGGQPCSRPQWTCQVSHQATHQCNVVSSFFAQVHFLTNLSTGKKLNFCVF